MKIKRQFFILSSFIISIPILCSFFIILHTYIHSPNRYLIEGSMPNGKLDLPNLSDEDIDNLQKSLKMLPQEVQAILCRTADRKIIYSTVPEIKPGIYMKRDEIWNFATRTSDKYFYQFSRLPSTGNDTMLITRLSLERIQNERKTKTYLKVLFAVILITFTSLIIIFFISRTIFVGLGKIQKSSSQLADGKFDKPVLSEEITKESNEFDCIMNSLEKMRKELLENQLSKNRFITGISHDLRTPVAVIKGYSEAIMDDVITDKNEIKESMELIEQKTAQLEEMIDTLINFMKLNDKEIKEKLVPESITDLIRDFAKYVEITGKVFKRNVKTDIQLPDNITVPLNNQLVHRSFENLLSNAIRYTNEGDLIEIISYKTRKQSQNFIILKIKDSGSGIDKKDLDYIFDIFYRGTNSRKEEGMGVGLAVVKSIMETHGWQISVESAKKKGSCFTITIPYK